MGGAAGALRGLLGLACVPLLLPSAELLVVALLLLVMVLLLQGCGAGRGTAKDDMCGVDGGRSCWSATGRLAVNQRQSGCQPACCCTCSAVDRVLSAGMAEGLVAAGQSEAVRKDAELLLGWMERQLPALHIPLGNVAAAIVLAGGVGWAVGGAAGGLPAALWRWPQWQQGPQLHCPTIMSAAPD